MKTELQEKLFKDFPLIFKQKENKNAVMARGVECNDGWYLIIRALCSNIQNRIDNPHYVEKKGVGETLKQLWNKTVWNHVLFPLLRKLPYEEYLRHEKLFKFKSPVWQKPPTSPQVEFEQVKEKFGSLRIYNTNSNDYVDGLMDMAVSMSYLMCEDCGSTTDVKRTPTTWIRMLCPKCTKKFVGSYNKRTKPTKKKSNVKTKNVSR